MSRDYPKAVRRQLRELRAQAHENELAAELVKLAGKFDEWRSGRISAGELTDLIHAYHNGPARQLWSYYNAGDDDLLVASAFVTGVLKQSDVPEDVRQHIQGLIEFCRRND